MRCNICNCDLFEDGNFMKCSNCFLVVKKAIPIPLEEKERYLAHQYDDNYEKYIYGLVDFIDFNNKKVLDYGCGQNPILSKKYKSAIFTNYDYFFYPDLAFKEKKYDIILMIEVIEHIKDIKGTIELLLGLLNENGSIYIHTKLYDNNTDFKTWWYQRDITHISFFNIKTFEYISNAYKIKYELINNFIILKKV